MGSGAQYLTEHAKGRRHAPVWTKNPPWDTQRGDPFSNLLSIVPPPTMCYALNAHQLRQAHQLQQQHTRRRRTSQIQRLLQRAYAVQHKHASPLIFTSLALKIERILYRTFPHDDDVLMAPEVLEVKLRHVIKRILLSKDSVTLQPNNYSIDE
ncbi:hypothetical protein DYB32_007227 [Aphanomyces invadans]|uniref:Uncharacterized protein n=2 Tax=Aphanomyces invadans TaxID=157072 RepID=A0A3R7A5S8_9STRA|nr:hypothetical protein DYB32_007227 [Aphanomyces invadans]